MIIDVDLADPTLAASHRTHSDRARDLDRAGYGLVKMLPESPGETSLRWERREAFFTVADRFARSPDD